MSTSTTTSEIASTTTTRPQNYGSSISSQANNFFFIACSILGVFLVCTGCCCITMRYRKRRMQRIAMAAFQQGVFQHAEVGQRVNASGREAPVVQDKAERPQLYEVWQHEHAVCPVPSTHARISRPLGHWSEYQPISAGVSGPNAIQSRLSGFPIDTQLAYLFHAKVQLKREWKRSLRPRSLVPPYILEHGQTTPSLHPLQPNSPPERPLLRLSVLIAMPAPPVSLSATSDLMLGVALAPCEDIPIDNDDTKDTKPKIA